MSKDAHINHLKSLCLSSEWAPYGEYLVGNYGEVISTKRKPRVLKQTFNNVGYSYVSIMKDGKPIKTTVHRLVALMHIDGKKDTVNHKNGIKSDNRVDNLEWASYKDNNDHAKNEKLNQCFCESHHNAKLSNIDVAKIKSMKGFATQQEIAIIFGVCRQTIGSIHSGKGWSRHED